MAKVDYVREIVNRYIELGITHNTSYSKRFIATVLQSEHPDLFKTVEEARAVVRTVTGTNGKKLCKKDEQLIRDFALLEQPVVECELKPYTVGKQYKKAFNISDVHSRFHDRKALEIAINNGAKNGCDICIINGDLLDFYQVSRFDKNPNILQYFYSEREWVQDFLLLLQKTFGKVVFKKGNHDIRRELLLQRKAMDVPEIQGLESISDYVFFDNSTVEIVEDYNIIEFGRLNFIHGHEYQGGGGIHVAYNRMNKAMDNVISAHSHVTQNSMKKSLSGKFYGSWTVGCLCSLSPRYNPQNNWNHGFAIIEREDDGKFEVQNKMIVDGKIF